MDCTVRADQRPFKVGVLLPTIEGGMARATPRWTDLVAMAQRGEAVGFDSIWLVDHFFYHMPRREEQAGVWECWTLLSALAAATSRVELGTLVLCTGFRNPALLAKMADTVEEISGGRLILGLGAGWNEYEYKAFGYPFDHRVSRFEEALTIIHGLLKNGEVNFVGRFNEARECALRPRGPRPGGPPLMIGSSSPRMLGLTARYADQWNTFHTSPENLAARRADVDAACHEAGRDPATLVRTAAVRVNLLGRTGSQGAAAPPLTGTPEAIAAGLLAYVREGATHLQLIPDPSTLAGIEALAPVLELLDRAAV
ncbi:MAG: LLM class flavin-dependent oxidoreductase [Chloroflexota bacterium]|nr:LLM class flavin-dependent oxidoreductase [Chloroflexota bacterium]